MIQIYGHPRSGTHLLASMVHRAFFPELEPLKMHNKNTGHWTRRSGRAKYCIDGEEREGKEIEIPYGKLLGTHAFVEDVEDLSRALYIMRDGRDVAVSVWKWKKFHPKRLGDDISLEEYLQTPIDWKGSPGRIARPKEGYVLFDHWRDHVDGWLGSEALCMRYEHLVTDPGFFIDCIAHYFRLTLRQSVTLPNATGWNPSGGRPKIGAWKRVFSKALEDLFEQKVPKNHLGRWENGG